MQQRSIYNVALGKLLLEEPFKATIGRIVQVDLVQREITVSTGSHLHQIDVPPQCPVMLRGERVKLRILQPGDIVRISSIAEGARFVAARVEVAPVNSLPAAGKT